MSLNLKSSGGGSVTVDVPSTASNYTATLPANNGTIITTASTFASTGPAFSVWSNTASSVTNAANVPIVFDNKVFDTDSAWNITTSRFTPLVAGYYQIEAMVQYATGNYAVGCAVAKNGTLYKYLGNTGTAAAAVNGSTVVYLNGSTDYIQIFGSSATTQNSATGATITHCSGFLARVA